MNGQVAHGIPDVGSPIAQYAAGLIVYLMIFVIFGPMIALMITAGDTSTESASSADSERRNRQLSPYTEENKRLGGTKPVSPTGFGARVGSEAWMLRSYIMGFFGPLRSQARQLIFIQEVCECRDQFDARCSHAEIRHQAEVMVYAGFLKAVPTEVQDSYSLTEKGKKERRRENIATNVACAEWAQLVKRDGLLTVPDAWQEV